MVETLEDTCLQAVSRHSCLYVAQISLPHLSPFSSCLSLLPFLCLTLSILVSSTDYTGCVLQPVQQRKEFEAGSIKMKIYHAWQKENLKILT